MYPAEPSAKRKPRHLLLDVVSIALLGLLAFLVWQLFAAPFSGESVPLAILAFFAGKIFVDITFFRAHPPTIASDARTREKIVERIKAHAELQQNKTYHVVDCGAGMGELAAAIAKALPEANVQGLETSWLPFSFASLRRYLSGLNNLRITRGDIFAHDFSGVAATTMYLNAPLTQKMGEKLWQEMKPGSLVIAHSFELSGPWPAPETISLPPPFAVQLFVYVKAELGS